MPARVGHVKEQVICKQEFEMSYQKQITEDFLTDYFPSLSYMLNFGVSLFDCILSFVCSRELLTDVQCLEKTFILILSISVNMCLYIS